MKHKRCRVVVCAQVALATALGPCGLLGVVAAQAQEVAPVAVGQAVQGACDDWWGSEGDEQVPAKTTDAHDGIEFAAWSDDASLPTVAGAYFLTTDVTLAAPWEVAADVKLCLNGHAILADFDAPDGGYAVRVAHDAKLELFDCVGSGRLVPGEGRIVNSGVDVDGGATFAMNGGTISGFANGVFTDLITADKDRGIEKASFGFFTMNGGTISRNSSKGVYVFSGTFEMKGGLITENGSAGDDGAGVYVSYSTFTMTGGEISHNTALRNGGGVYVYATGEVSLLGGTITANEALGQDAPGGLGGGVCVQTNAGVQAQLTIGGDCTISGNTAAVSGGGVYSFGKKLSNASETVIKVSGAPRIFGNVAAGVTNNVQLTGNPLNVCGLLEPGALIGITPVHEANGQVSPRSKDKLTAGYRDAGNAVDPEAYFTSDDASLVIGWSKDSREARQVEAHKVSVSTSEHGSVSASRQIARWGDRVTLTVTPEAGYVLKKLSVRDDRGVPLFVDGGAFTMLARDVTVSATFEPIG